MTQLRWYRALFILVAAYALWATPPALRAQLPTQSTGHLITATEWNDVINAVNANTTAIALRPWTLLKANSGTSTNASAENLDTYAVSGLTAKDQLFVRFSLRSATQATADPILRNTTDTIKIADLNSAAAISGGGNASISADQTGSGTVWIYPRRGSLVDILGELDGFGNSSGAKTGARIASTFSTNWTGSWTIALRHAGVTAGGTLHWEWWLYKVAGQ